MNSVSKTVVISDATIGIGLSLVHAFLKEGYNVVGLAAATKGGINHVTQALALELAPFGVTVNAIAAGVTSRPMHAPETHAAKGALHPLGRIANTADIDQAVLYLARAEFVTGVILPVDGGFSVSK